MQRLIVLRLAAGLVALFTGAALLFSWAAAPPAPVAAETTSDSGAREAALFEERCGRCHAREELLEWLGRRSDADPGGALLEFLAEHGEASNRENRAIVVYLETLATPP
jgi:mono/diheme cytochrome c family protein